MNFRPSCEQCGTLVDTTDLRRVRCDDCKTTQTRTTTANKVKQFAKDREQPKPRAACAGCGTTSNIARCYQLDPRNWHETHSLRCKQPECRNGWTAVSYERAYLEAASSVKPRRAA